MGRGVDCGLRCEWWRDETSRRDSGNPMSAKLMTNGDGDGDGDDNDNTDSRTHHEFRAKLYKEPKRVTLRRWPLPRA